MSPDLHARVDEVLYTARQLAELQAVEARHYTRGQRFTGPLLYVEKLLQKHLTTLAADLNADCRQALKGKAK